MNGGVIATVAEKSRRRGLSTFPYRGAESFILYDTGLLWSLGTVTVPNLSWLVLPVFLFVPFRVLPSTTSSHQNLMRMRREKNVQDSN